MTMRGVTTVFVCSLGLLGAAADSDAPETASTEAIARFTTEPRYLSPWVATVPESAQVPSPLDFFGHVSGAAGELTYSDRAYAYYRALAKASPRVHVETIGKTEEGREIVLVAIADEDGIRDLERLKAATAALADPRKTDEAAAAGAHRRGASHLLLQRRAPRRRDAAASRCCPSSPTGWRFRKRR